MNPITDKNKDDISLETIFNNTDFLIAYLDNNFNFIQVNRAYAEKHNKDPDFFVGKNHFELYPHKGNEKIFKEVLETGDPYFSYSKPLDHPVLGISYWDWVIKPLRNESNDIIGILLSLTDVTDYKRNEKEFEKIQEDFIDELVEKRADELINEQAANEMKLAESTAGEIEELNKKIEKLENANNEFQESIMAKSLEIEELDHEISKLKKAPVEFKDDLVSERIETEKFNQQINELEKSRDELKEKLTSKNSMIEELNHQINQLTMDNAEFKEYITVKNTEIENLNQVITELETSQNTFKENISAKESELEDLNQEIAKLKESNNTSKEFFSNKLLEIEDLNNKFIDVQNKLDISKGVISAKNREIEESKEIISAKLLEINELDENINDQEKIIQDLINTNKNLEIEIEKGSVNEELLKQLDDLIKTNEELENFADAITQQLQEPLRTTSSFIQILAKRHKGKIDKDTDEFIDYILDAINRMQILINDLREYSRVESRGKEFKLTNTQEIVDYAISNFKDEIYRTNAEITCDNLPKVVADSGQLLLLFQNILDNALKFKKQSENPEIRIAATKDIIKNEYVFSVQDNGIGIDEQYLEDIFYIFRQLHPKQAYEGTGTGLTVCKKIIERHDGRIWVESEPGTGSTFFFTVPSKLIEKRL
ncbi:MAG: PAS domain-containing protein [Methanobacterium sp.]|uniref:ATP-binding protein n=1 Tax=Methanobacterium sp. TaxID=2164 RepID=UPI003D64CE14|nr:PAS domain-containing protein [Methanobacterium sp.]